MARKKLKKLIYFLCLEWRKKEGKKYVRKFGGKFSKISGKNFPHFFVRKVMENHPNPNPTSTLKPQLSLH